MHRPLESQSDLRIGLISYEHPDLGSAGGVWSYTRAMAEGLQAIGNEAFIFVPSPHSIQNPDASVPVHSVAARSSLQKLPFPLGRGPSIALAREISRLCESLRIDVLELPEYPGLACFLKSRERAGTAAVVRVHGPDSMIRANNSTGIRIRSRNAIHNSLVRRSILSADAVSVSSAQVWDSVQAQLKIKREDFFTLPCPVADSLFQVESAEVGDPVILCVGRLGWVKGDDLLVQAMPRVLERFPNAVLKFAGEYHDTTSIALRSHLPGAIARQIEFLGQVRQNQVPQLLQQAQVCVFPSRWESFGIACAEAMAAGRPVIVSRAHGFATFVQDGKTGIVVATEDVPALADAICRTLADKHLRASLAQAGRAHIQRLCSKTTVAKQATELYARVKGRAPLKRPC
jgi:glycosyltransferase involved in cell wall biosynthesis